jgi:hypothetical protein
VVVAISELAKRSAWLGGILAALPVTSLLALAWLWIDTHDIEKVAGLSMGIFWAVIPSLAFFPLFAWLMRMGWSFGLSLTLASLATAGTFYLYFAGLKQPGISP